MNSENQPRITDYTTDTNAAQQVLDDIGEKEAWLEQWKASAGDLTARRNLFNDLLNRVYGRPPQAVIGFDGDADPADLAARGGRIRELSLGWLEALNLSSAIALPIVCLGP